MAAALVVFTCYLGPARHQKWTVAVSEGDKHGLEDERTAMKMAFVQKFGGLIETVISNIARVGLALESVDIFSCFFF